jgi:hypothetical protein
MQIQLWRRAARREAGPRRPALFALAAPILLYGALATGAPPSPATAPAARIWQPGAVYAQIGPSCVGAALAGWLDAAPYPVDAHASGWQIYEAAHAADGIPGPHTGTTVAAAIPILARLGYVRDWRTTRDVATALAFLRGDGPLVLEGDFPTGRAALDSSQNLLWTGPLGRHAWFCYGVDRADRLSCQESAGSAWNAAEGGRFHMTRAALVAELAHGQAWLLHKPVTREG